MSKVTAFTLSTLRNEEILGMSLEIAEKLKNVIIVADSALGKAFLDAIPDYASALDLEKTLTYKDLVWTNTTVDQAITGYRLRLYTLRVGLCAERIRSLVASLCARPTVCVYTRRKKQQIKN